jgi:hypothetical protein
MQLIILQLGATNWFTTISYALQFQNWHNMFLGYTIMCATNMQLMVYKMDTCHKNNDLN